MRYWNTSLCVERVGNMFAIIALYLQIKDDVSTVLHMEYNSWRQNMEDWTIKDTLGDPRWRFVSIAWRVSIWNWNIRARTLIC